jgi:hypothetical protein
LEQMPILEVMTTKKDASKIGNEIVKDNKKWISIKSQNANEVKPLLRICIKCCYFFSIIFISTFK